MHGFQPWNEWVDWKHLPDRRISRSEPPDELQKGTISLVESAILRMSDRLYRWNFSVEFSPHHNTSANSSGIFNWWLPSPTIHPSFLVITEWHPNTGYSHCQVTFKANHATDCRNNMLEVGVWKQCKVLRMISFHFGSLIKNKSQQSTYTTKNSRQIHSILVCSHRIQRPIFGNCSGWRSSFTFLRSGIPIWKLNLVRYVIKARLRLVWDRRRSVECWWASWYDHHQQQPLGCGYSSSLGGWCDVVPLHMTVVNFRAIGQDSVLERVAYLCSWKLELIVMCMNDICFRFPCYDGVGIFLVLWRDWYPLFVSEKHILLESMEHGVLHYLAMKLIRACDCNHYQWHQLSFSTISSNKACWTKKLWFKLHLMASLYTAWDAPAKHHAERRTSFKMTVTLGRSVTRGKQKQGPMNITLSGLPTRFSDIATSPNGQISLVGVQSRNYETKAVW